MKKVFLLFGAVLILLVFSCKSKPEVKEDENETSQLTEEGDAVVDTDYEDALSDAEQEGETEITAVEFDEDNLIEDDQEMLAEAPDEFPAEADEADQLAETDLTETYDLASADGEDSQTDQNDQLYDGSEIAAGEQIQPPPEPPRPPPLPPPALLAPAEEKPRQTAQEKPPAQAPANQTSGPPKNGNALNDILIPPPVVSAVRDTPALLTGIPSPDSDIIYSRIVRATVGQTIEIPFRGTGWVYLGELSSRRGIVYESRRLDSEGQSFVFRAEEAGMYSLKFYKQDFIRDYILNDFVQVVVGESPATGGAGWFNPPFDRGRVTADPRWPSALEEAEMQRRAATGTRPASSVPVFTPTTTAPETPSAEQPPVVQPPVPSREATSSQGSTASAGTSSQTGQPPAVQPPVTQTTQPPSATQSQPPVVSAPQPPVADTSGNFQDIVPPIGIAPPETQEEMLKKAQDAFEEGNVTAAIKLLDQFREYYPSGNDELYWLYGQFYEANTPSRDILLSLDYYRRLVDEYPQSLRYNDARRRIAYLERFYINIQ